MPQDGIMAGFDNETPVSVMALEYYTLLKLVLNPEYISFI